MTKKKQTVSLVTALALSLTMLLTGCGQSGSTSTSTTSAGTAASGNTTFTVALASDSRGFDPANAYDHNTNASLLQVVQGLFAYDENGNVIPVLAKSYQQTNPTTYVYQLRDDVSFSDGSKLTADDVVFSLQYQKDPKVASEEAWMFTSVKSIEKTGDYQVTVKLTKPDALWSKALATTAGLVFSKADYEKHKDSFGTPTGKIIGTGPYVLQNWNSGSEIDLVKNSNYWDKTAALPFDKIVFKIIKDDTTRYEALKAGQVDLAYDLPNQIANQADQTGKLHAIYADSYATKYITFNTKKAPFSDTNVRKAIYYAIDRDSILKNIVKDEGNPANSLLIDATFTADAKDLWADYLKNAKDYTYNINTAKEYLAKSSAPNGFSFELTYKDTSANNGIALLIQQSLKQLNINVTLNKVTADEFAADKFGGNLDANGVGKYEVLLDNWGSDFPDPDGDLSSLYLSANATAGGSNDAGYSNPTLDKVIQAASASTDKTQRAKLLQQAYTIASEEVPYAALYYQKNIFVFSNRIDAKISASWLYNLFFKDFSIKK